MRNPINRAPMDKEKLIEILRSILKVDIDLSFLMHLEKSDIETLVACVRQRIDDIQ